MRVSAKNSAMHTLHFATLLEWCIVPAASLDLRILPVFRSDALAHTAFPGGDRTDNSGGPPSGPYKELFCLSASRICPRKDLPPIFVFISCPPGCRGRPLRPTGCGRLARTALCPTKTSGSAA